MEKKYFKRMGCAICGRKATMNFIRGRLKGAPRGKIMLCVIGCRHCAGGVVAGGNNKEAAKAEAVRRWNARQAQNLVAMERFLKKIFCGGANEH